MTTHTRTILRRAAAVAAVLALVVAGPALALRSQSTGTYLEIEVQAGTQSQVVKLSLGPGRVRMDLAQGPQDMSMISVGGEDGKMLMIQHTQKMYFEFTADQMASLAAMAGQTPQQAEEQPGNDTPPTFTRTGNTKQIGEWNAYEVRVEHPDQDGELTMWFSQDVGADFRALAEQFMDSMSSLLNNPMLSSMGGGGANLGLVQAQLGMMELPDGFPVQVISSNGGMASTTTLKAINQAASFDASTWEAPDGYQKIQLPIRR